MARQDVRRWLRKAAPRARRYGSGLHRRLRAWRPAGLPRRQAGGDALAKLRSAWPTSTFTGAHGYRRRIRSNLSSHGKVWTSAGVHHRHRHGARHGRGRPGRGPLHNLIARPLRALCSRRPVLSGRSSRPFHMKNQRPGLAPDQQYGLRCPGLRTSTKHRGTRGSYGFNKSDLRAAPRLFNATTKWLRERESGWRAERQTH